MLLLVKMTPDLMRAAFNPYTTGENRYNHKHVAGLGFIVINKLTCTPVLAGETVTEFLYISVRSFHPHCSQCEHEFSSPKEKEIPLILWNLGD